MKTNIKTTTRNTRRPSTKKVAQPVTHGGSAAMRTSKENELRRSVMSCMLFEGEFYEDGVAIAKRIETLVKSVPFDRVAEIAIEAREKMHLRHVPLWLTVALLKNGHGSQKMGQLIADVCQRADEPAELLSMYWKDQPGAPLTNQLKIGLAKALQKFSEYQLAKYNRDADVKLRDILFLTHAKPVDQKGRGKKVRAIHTSEYDRGSTMRHKNSVLTRLAENTLTTPDTWEVSLSAGADKKKTFERLMKEEKLGALAFLRNLRNMTDVGLSKKQIIEYAMHVDTSKVLPFRYVAAARAVPTLEDVIEPMFMNCTSQQEKLPGKTVVIVDVSGSMRSGSVSGKSDLSRLDVAGSLAAVLREVCEDCALYATAGNDRTRKHATTGVAPRRGFALIDMFTEEKFQPKIGWGGIFLVQCLDYVKNLEKTADRIIVLTDEQDCDNKLQPDQAKTFGKFNYLINVASYKNGVGYGNWTHIDGWSDAIIDYIRVNEEISGNNNQ